MSMNLRRAAALAVVGWYLMARRMSARTDSDSKERFGQSEYPSWGLGAIIGTPASSPKKAARCTTSAAMG